ncbi:unnamed protein product, partial [Pocillopora meandrina]
MYRGHFHYFTGPKIYYPNKAMDSSPPLKPPVTLIEKGIARMTLKETKDMREFATSLRRSVRQHSPSSNVETTALMEGQNDAQQQDREQPFSSISSIRYFKSKQVIAVKLNRRREYWQFFLALLLKDLLVKERKGKELSFIDNVVYILWLDNVYIGYKLVFSEAYQDDRNSPHTIIDRARIDEIINDASGLRSYKNERLFKGGDNSDIDSEDSSKMKDPTKGPMRICVFFSTRSGRLATRLQL